MLACNDVGTGTAAGLGDGDCVYRYDFRRRSNYLETVQSGWLTEHGETPWLF